MAVFLLAVVFFIVVFKDSKGFSLFTLSAAGLASPWRRWPWTTTTSLEVTPPSSPISINIKQRDEKLEKVEAGLARARALIREAALNPNGTSPLPSSSSYVPQGYIYRNAHAFHRSYLLMEKLFKIFVYEEREPPLFHYGPCKNIYSMEGIFMSLMETKTEFRIRNPEEAPVYFLPFSVVMIIEHLFDPIIHDKAVLQRTVSDYVGIVSHKYGYWNRSLGTDHFIFSYHDWGPRATWGLPPSRRTILAFFAGRLHGKIRPALLRHWKEKDKDVQVYEKLPQDLSYQEMLKKSRFCICPSGHEVASPRIVEAIYVECVLVLISQHYVLSLSDVLDWDTFSIWVLESEISNLKKILMRIPKDQYMRMLNVCISY
ncbi:hypothetical protein ACOSP7_002966 [Xanthoceras sorbifolium]